MKASIDLYK
jgi:predicted nuclease with TOPRIM domain